jgi:lipid-A-disaccharide synthase
VASTLRSHGFDPQDTWTNEPAGRLMRRTRASLVASGTATLEAALAGRPFAVFYRTSALTFAIARRLVKLRWVSLANLVAEAPVVREYVQGDFHADALVAEIDRLLGDVEDRQRIQAGCATIRQRLGTAGASRRVADFVTQLATTHREPARPSPPGTTL